MKIFCKDIFEINWENSSSFILDKSVHVWLTDVRTKEIYLRDKKLFIRLTSAPLKEELFYAADKIKKMLNEQLGGEYVEEVKFL